MASTNKTENLHLNQWVETDPVLREDFNADNSVLDAALGDVPWVRLMDVVTTEEVSQLELDISSVDVSRFMEYRVICSLEGPASGNSTGSGRIRVNGLSTSQYYGSGGTQDYLTPCGRRYQVRIAHVPNQRIWTLVQQVSLSSSAMSSSANGYCTVSTLDRINTINFYVYSGTVPAGTRLVLLGMR